MSKPMLIPTSTHWGNFNVETRNGRVAAIHPAEHDTRALRHRPVFARLAGCRLPHSATLHPRGLAEAAGQERWRKARRRAVRRRALGRGAGHGGGCAAPRGRRARQRGDLRRLLWLGERWSFPPFAEPAASLSQPARRLHLLRPVLLHRHGPGDHPPCARRRVLQADERGADDRGRAGAYPPGGELRRHLDEEHADQPGRHRRPFRARPPRALARRRRRGGLHQPGAGRRRRFSRCGLVADPPQCRCRADAGPGAHAAQRGPARQGVPSLPLRRLRALRRPICSGRAMACQKMPTGRRRSATSRRTGSERSPAGWRASPAFCRSAGRCSGPRTAISPTG